jgi:hypothetical protein
MNAIATYVWMDDDWMGEFRFATVVVLATFVAAALVADTVARLFPAKRVVVAAVGALTIAAVAANTVPRIRTYAADPSTPYADVSRRTSKQFTAYGAALHIERPSILAADIGATLYEGTLRVHDLAGLIEPDVVRTLKNNTQFWLFDHPKFYDWVFDEIKPTFISTDKFWTYVPAFEKDPRFRRDYVAIDTFTDRYVQNVYHQVLHSGDFVRRDALPQPGIIEQMRQSYQPPPLPDMTVGANASPDQIAAVARALDARARPHDARGLWQSVLAMGPSANGPGLYLEALDRLGDGRKTTSGGDALDAEMSAGLRLLYTDHQLEPALNTFNEILRANPAHYGALFQRARALTLLDRKEPARSAWQTVALLAARINDYKTAATAAAELAR